MNMAAAIAMTDVQRDYELAFVEFSQRVREVQRLTRIPNVDQSIVEAALVELERARAEYDRCRDAVARELLPEPQREIFLRLSPDAPAAHQDRVRSVAELLWEASGRPEGTADQDWRRAEEIVRRASAA